jgi:hypothetical protein
MFLKKLFAKSINAKPTIKFPKYELDSAIKTNRDSLKLIDNWIDEAAFKNSFFAYGVPDFIKEVLNKPINNKPTYSDYMLLIGNKYFEKVNYFEIGVSVGKNFFQIMNGLNNARFTGFDIEEVNPIIDRQLKLEGLNEWETPPGSIKKNKSSLRRYKYNEKEVAYVSADVWDANSWSKLKGEKFNIVFSDALHTPEAILFEFEMIIKYNLLSDKFVIVWDDLVGQMKDSFFQIIRKYDKVFNLKEVYLLDVNGWVGENEKPHTVGIISNFTF